MDYYFVLASEHGYFKGWLPIPDVDEPDFTNELMYASRFTYGNVQYMKEILKEKHNILTKIKKVILQENYNEKN